MLHEGLAFRLQVQGVGTTCTKLLELPERVGQWELRGGECRWVGNGRLSCV